MRKRKKSMLNYVWLFLWRHQLELYLSMLFSSWVLFRDSQPVFLLILEALTHLLVILLHPSFRGFLHSVLVLW